MKLYRGMRADVDGLPAVGPTARTLGVRGMELAPHHDVPVSDPAALVPPGVGGLSVVPDDPLHLPRQRRPASLGGISRDAVWEIDANDLGPLLSLRRDRANHGTVEPAVALTLAEYQAALAATRDRWRKVAE